MIKWINIILLLLPVVLITHQTSGQQPVSNKLAGAVSYKSARNVYVRFESTVDLKAGDTLYIQRDNKMIPALVIENLSSISCVCTLIEGVNLLVSDEIYAFPVSGMTDEIPVYSTEEELVVLPVVSEQSDTISSEVVERNVKQQISGRFSISSYSDFSNADTDDGQRMKYVLALNASNINDSRVSFESYIAFSHENDRWDEIKSNFYNGLKIYNLAINYQMRDDMTLWLGRKINPKVSSLGAIDGVQFEKKINHVALGVVAGSRPDWSDYSFNSSLFQAGIYASHEFANEKITMQNTMAIVDQENNWNTDRRFLYIQHTSRLSKKVYFFGSGEFDLYKKVDNQPQNIFKLSNLYLQLRYRMFRNFSVSMAYSARNNLILYETYKTFIEQLLETEMLQGYVLSANLKPVRNINVGVKAGYRNRPGDLSASKNLYSYVNFARLPVWDLSADLTAIFLKTSYLKGSIFGVRLSRDLIPGKLYASASYRKNNYEYFNQEYSLAQNTIELNLSLQLKWRIYASLNNENTLDKEMSFHRIYLNLTKRF